MAGKTGSLYYYCWLAGGLTYRPPVKYLVYGFERGKLLLTTEGSRFVHVGNRSHSSHVEKQQELMFVERALHSVVLSVRVVLCNKRPIGWIRVNSTSLECDWIR